MKIDFYEYQEIKMPCMNDGTGMMTVKMYNDENYRTIPTRIHKGGSIGLHPLLTLAAMYIGFRLIGVAGMLLSPAVALALSLLASSPAKPPS